MRKAIAKKKKCKSGGRGRIKVTPALEKKMARLADSGMSQSAIGRKVGLSQSTVSGYLRGRPTTANLAEYEGEVSVPPVILLGLPIHQYLTQMIEPR